jgi:soluble lytic murein transglycosylase
MLVLGFLCHQISVFVKANPPEISRQVGLEQQIRIEMPTEKSVTKELIKKLDTKSQIVKAISASCSSLGEADISKLADVIQAESKKYDYDWKLILAIIKTESQYDIRARSHKGARGLMQVMPSTAKWLSPKMGLEYTGRDALYDPEYNVKLGTRYLYMLHQKFSNMDKAIVAYNRGPSGLTRYLRQGRKFPPEYLIRVMDRYKELKDGSGEYAS